MQTRTEIDDSAKIAINHAVAAKRSLDAARNSIDTLIDTTVEELISERHPSATIGSITADRQDPDAPTDEVHAIILAIKVFPLPRFNGAYAVTQGLRGVVKLRRLSDRAPIIGTVIYSWEIPLVNESGPDHDLTIESLAIALTELRRELLGTGIEG